MYLVAVALSFLKNAKKKFLCREMERLKTYLPSGDRGTGSHYHLSQKTTILIDYDN